MDPYAWCFCEACTEEAQRFWSSVERTRRQQRQRGRREDEEEEQRQRERQEGQQEGQQEGLQNSAMIRAIVVEMSDVFDAFDAFDVLEGFLLDDEAVEQLRRPPLSAEEIEASLSRVPEADASALPDEEMCPICLSSLNCRSTVSRIGTCRHAFCDPCIRTWLSTPRGAHCPVCKRSVVST